MRRKISESGKLKNFHGISGCDRFFHGKSGSNTPLGTPFEMLKLKRNVYLAKNFAKLQLFFAFEKRLFISKGIYQTNRRGFGTVTRIKNVLIQSHKSSQVVQIDSLVG